MISFKLKKRKKQCKTIIFHISRSPFPIRIFLFIFPGKKGIRLLLINAIPTPFKKPNMTFSPLVLLSKWRFVWWHSSQKKWYRKSEGYLYTWHVLFLQVFFCSLKSKYTTCFIVWKIGGFCGMSVSERKKNETVVKCFAWTCHLTLSLK